MAFLFAVLGAAFLQVEAPLPKPWIRRVAVADDTVWFEGERADDSARVRYCFARRAGSWCALPRAGRSERRAELIPRSEADSVTLAPGLTLVCHPPLPSGADCERFGLTIGDRRLVPLAPRADASTLAMLEKASGVESEERPTMSDFVTAWAATDDAIWFGLGGGFPEGQGAYGGLLRFDRAAKTVGTVVHPALASATVTGLAVDGRTLWIGTMHPAEFGPVGSTGVLRQDLRSGRWATLDSAGQHLPDKVIHAIAAWDGAVFIATRDGLAVFDTRTARWSVRFFRRTTIGGAIAHTLTESRPPE